MVKLEKKVVQRSTSTYTNSNMPSKQIKIIEHSGLVIIHNTTHRWIYFDSEVSRVLESPAGDVFVINSMPHFGFINSHVDIFYIKHKAHSVLTDSGMQQLKESEREKSPFPMISYNAPHHVSNDLCQCVFDQRKTYYVVYFSTVLLIMTLASFLFIQ